MHAGEARMKKAPFSDCETWEKVFDLLPSLVFLMDGDCRVAWLNQAAVEHLNDDLAQLLGKKCSEIIGFSREFCEHCSQVRSSTISNFVGRQLKVDALHGWFDVTIKHIEKNRNDFSGVVISAYDVSKAIQVEEACSRAERQYRSIFDNSLEGIFQTSVSGQIVRANKALASMLGYETPEELIRNVQNIADLYARPENRKDLLEALQEHGAVHDFGICIKRQDGEQIWLSLNARGIIQEGQLQYLEGYVRDITQLVQTRHRLHENELFLRTVMNGIRAAIFVIAPKTGLVVESNTEAQRLVGLLAEALEGCNFNDIATLTQKDENMLSSDGLNTEGVLTRPDGVNIPVIRSTLGLSWKGCIHRVEILFDITERKNLERGLLHAQKMESIGELAAGIAHEINTPMQYVDGNLQFLKTVFEAYDEIIRSVPSASDDETFDFYREETPKALEQAQEGVERVTTIVKAMKRFSHPGVKEKVPTDINKAVENTVTIARNEWKYTADVKLDLDSDLPAVPCFPGDFNQALLNILINAAHAVQGTVGEGDPKGLITLTTKTTGPFVRISIADTGTGIPEQARSRIFDPFFTTKEPGKGTGQGLALTYSIIKKHKGTIDFESEVGKGTTFNLYLPLEAPAEEI
jgi:PAS domain S-box-containing protein